MDLIFFVNSVFLGVGLAMDAFSVSLANGLNENKMRFRRMCAIAGVYAFFQFFMPMVGWICVHTVVGYFSRMQFLIPWIALFLLLWIGGKMIFESVAKKSPEEESPASRLSFRVLLVQGVATSIDALSVGFTIAEYDLLAAFSASLIIAVVTFLICVAGLGIGKTVGTRLAGKAGIFGGVILIFVGIEIFIGGTFF